jgi:2-oxoglutarate ferredoxin oxidoreductase subunit delta
MSASPVRLDLELCKACGICIELCPDAVFDRDRLGYPVLARPEECSRCLLCELHCPDFAIEVQRRARKGKPTGTDESAPALTRDDLVAASQSAAEEHAGCGHDGEDG